MKEGTAVPAQPEARADRSSVVVRVVAVIWALWVVLPSLLTAPATVTPGGAQRLIGSQVGAVAIPYLGAAPGCLLVYLFVAHLMALPVLVTLADAVRVAARGNGRQSVYAILARRFGTWAAFYFVGMAAASLVALARGAPIATLLSWVPHLALGGFAATLPQLGWVFAVTLWGMRFWRSIVTIALGAIACAVVAPVLTAQGVTSATPMVLRAHLLAGRSDWIWPSLLGLLGWCVVPLAPVLLGRWFAAYRRLNPPVASAPCST